MLRSCQFSNVISHFVNVEIRSTSVQRGREAKRKGDQTRRYFIFNETRCSNISALRTSAGREKVFVDERILFYDVSMEDNNKKKTNETKRAIEKMLMRGCDVFMHS